MKNIILIFAVLIFNIAFSQKSPAKIADRYQSTQPQDQSVPPPPRIAFPAQFPTGNRAFLKKLMRILIKII